VPTCKTCGSERVVTDAWACWNPSYGLWELETSFDHAYCQQCEDETKLVWKRVEQPPNKRVQELNDAFRMRGVGGGSLMVTSGIGEQGQDFVVKAIEAVRTFSDFTADSDPYGEHDFGSVEIDGQKIFWKIDTYDLEMQAMSPNPGNPAVTHRVLTIMLASEY